MAAYLWMPILRIMSGSEIESKKVKVKSKEYSG